MIRQFTFIVSIAAIFTLMGGVCHADGSHEADQKTLLAGVTTIDAPGLPGPVSVFGKDAFPLVTGQVGDGLAATVVAASRLKAGRVVVFGHPGYLDAEALNAADTGALVQNAVRWLARPGSPVRVGVRQRPGLAAYLQAHGVTVDILDGAHWTDRLKDDAVVSCPLADLAPNEITALDRYLRGGGGLLAAELGWGWLQLNPNKMLTQHGGNRLLAPAGLVWSDGTLNTTAPQGYLAGAIPSEMLNASDALTVVLDTLSSSPPKGLAPATPAVPSSGQAVETVLLAVSSLPPDDKILLPRLNSLRTQHEKDPALRLETPLMERDLVERIALSLQVQQAMQAPAAQVHALPAAASFPGAVASDAARVTKTVKIDASVPEWHSTGLYAAPGEQITVTAPGSAVKQGLQVRIGAHTDTLWPLNKWERAPAITRVFPLNAAQTVAANAFGGAVYIVVPDGCTLGTISVTIGHAVEAPYFVKGETDPAAWRTAIRNNPAPWAELQGDNVILTVPSASVRALDDPQALMVLWDRIMDGYSDFAGIPHHRLRPERYCVDRQISVGYMHSGYPIMMGLDVANDVVSTHVILTNGDGKSKSWGFFHEMGHNHQQSDWTFDGTGEVTNNVFDLYIMETVCGLMSSQHPSLYPDAMQTRLEKYTHSGSDFNQWKNDPWIALTMYIELKEGFGWDAYKKVFAEYRALPDSARPKTDLEKRDQWMTRFSRTVGRNLGPFFQAWGVPTSPEASAALSDLPSWMPPDFPTQ
ncbi:MAG: M60 family metallopeptidase [Capsulimonas sp.]|uniref:M60 family metallopeptidase n=1 Tax=Capsulimonas sp. TaxID=2494211 RepID=UPI00326569F7